MRLGRGLLRVCRGQAAPAKGRARLRVLKGPCRQNRMLLAHHSISDPGTASRLTGKHGVRRPDQRDRSCTAGVGKGGVPPETVPRPAVQPGRTQRSRRWAGGSRWAFPRSRPPSPPQRSPSPARAFGSFRAVSESNTGADLEERPAVLRPVREIGTGARARWVHRESAPAGRCAAWALPVVRPPISPGPVPGPSRRGHEATVYVHQRLAGDVERFLPRLQLGFPWTGLPLRAFWGGVGGSSGCRRLSPVPAASGCKPGRYGGDWEPTSPARCPDPRRTATRGECCPPQTVVAPRWARSCVGPLGGRGSALMSPSLGALTTET